MARWVGLEPTVSDRGLGPETTKGAETNSFSPTKLPLLFQPTRRKVRSRLNLSNSPLTVRLAVSPASLAISIAWGALLAGYVLLALYALQVWRP